MNEPLPKEKFDVLIALQYDTCAAADKCEPCKGVRLAAIEEIIELRRSLAREENARKVLADENLRLMAKWKSIFEKGAILP